MQPVQRVVEPVEAHGVALACRRVGEILPSPSQIDAVVCGRVDVVVGN